MFHKPLFTLCLLLVASLAMAQLTPEVTTWKLNTTGATGYNSIPSNIQQVQYSTNDVYVSASCIPGYDIGPWPGIPTNQVPVNENFVYKITRHPVKNTATATIIDRGHIGVWSNGVSIFNAADAYSYNNAHTWNRSAVYFEGTTFDSCLGHPAPNGEYHTHVHPLCLYDDADSTHHSPIIGYAFDGFPVYGAYGYSDTAGTGPIKRMRSSYKLRSITTRDTLPNGTVVSGNQAGPAVSPSYPLSYFLEDYEFNVSNGDLDERNGRYCVTPEYPNGTYAYFVTIDNTLQPQFPYIYFGSYYGVVQAGNMDVQGTPGGHNTVTDSVQTYTGSTGITEIAQDAFSVKINPNPASNYISIFINPIAANNFILTMTDVSGKVVLSRSGLQPTISSVIDVSSLAQGTYFLQFTNGNISHTEKVVVKR